MHHLLFLNPAATKLGCSQRRPLASIEAPQSRHPWPPGFLDLWRASIAELRPEGQTQQSWLWAAPAKHSTRQISEVPRRKQLHYFKPVGNLAMTG
jgi:hypothetical protein